MNAKQKKTYFRAGVVLVIVVIALFFYMKSSDSAKYDNFAICLTENNVAMYGTNWCPHCQNQKKMFGDSFKYVDFKDCDVNPECEEVGVKAYPTWAIKDTLLEAGVMPLESLSALTGCPLQ